MRVNETRGALVAFKLGRGISQLPDRLVQAELARGERLELLSSDKPEPMPINIVFAPVRLLPARAPVAIEALGLLRCRAAKA